MGPAERTTTVPIRPKFSWDNRSIPWTDVKGKQEGYSDAVEQWSDYYDLHDINSNKIDVTVSGMCLRAQLYNRAVYLCKGIQKEFVKSSGGRAAIVNSLYKRPT